MKPSTFYRKVRQAEKYEGRKSTLNNPRQEIVENFDQYHIGLDDVFAIDETELTLVREKIGEQKRMVLSPCVTCHCVFWHR